MYCETTRKHVGPRGILMWGRAERKRPEQKRAEQVAEAKHVSGWHGAASRSGTVDDDRRRASTSHHQKYHHTHLAPIDVLELEWGVVLVLTS